MYLLLSFATPEGLVALGEAAKLAKSLEVCLLAVCFSL